MNILFYILVIIFLITFPAETANTALQALTIWATSVVPVLFPYMFFSRLLCAALSTLRLPAFLTVAVLGFLGGSPSGASLIAANASSLSERGLFTLCVLTGTISPMFILGSIQSWIDHPSMAGLFLLCHWLSAIVCACAVWLFYRGRRENRPIIPKVVNLKFSNPISQSIDAMFQIGGCIILYSVLAGMLGKILHAFPAILPFVHSMFEVSGGIHSLCQSILSPQLKYISIAAALGFSGFSILSQNHTMIQTLGMPIHRMILFAVFRAAISAVMMACMLTWLPIS